MGKKHIIVTELPVCKIHENVAVDEEFFGARLMWGVTYHKAAGISTLGIFGFSWR